MASRRTARSSSPTCCGHGCERESVSPGEPWLASFCEQPCSRSGDCMSNSCPHCGAKLAHTVDAYCSECHNPLDELPAVPHPVEPDTPAQTPDVWYSARGAAFRLFKLAWEDDRGWIQRFSDGIRFVGQRLTIQIAQLREAPVLLWIIPWTALVWQVIGNGLVLWMAWAGLFQTLTLETPLSYFLLAFANMMALFQWPMRWVRVDYVSPQGETGRAYFTAASAWRRWTGDVPAIKQRFEEFAHGAQVPQAVRRTTSLNEGIYHKRNSP